MRRVASILVISLVMAVAAGCQGPMQSDVIVQGGGPFPSFLVGKWVDEKTGWEFVFDADGQITNAVLALGRVDIKPGKVTRFKTRFGGKGVFEPGKWTITYSPDMRELGVRVVLDHFYQDLGPHAIEGHTADFLVGPISEDGTIWQADLFSSGQMLAIVDKDGKTETKELLDNAEPVERGRVVFKKVAE